MNIDVILAFSKETLNQLDFHDAKQVVPDNDDYHQLTKPAGEEHYRLLSFISHLCNSSTLYDIGTYKGLSAIAMSSNPDNIVVSYDIRYSLSVIRPDNVEFRLGDILNESNIAKSPFIFLDIDPHDGRQEKELFEHLVEIDFNGLLMLDDIHQFEGMRKFWKSITLPKYDLTHIGHWSGTGIVDFSC